MEEVYLLLGSNLGDCFKNLTDAADLLRNEVGPVTRASSLYRTAAWGNQNQPDFINQVLVIETLLNPQQLLKNIAVIENKLGRKRDERWGSRTIDIDILFYGKTIVEESDLTIPHIRLHERRFTLMPLMEIAPYLVHPKLNKTISELFENLTDTLPVQQLNI